MFLCAWIHILYVVFVVVVFVFCFFVVVVVVVLRVQTNIYLNMISLYLQFADVLGVIS